MKIAKHCWIIERDYEELKQESGVSYHEGGVGADFIIVATLCIAAYGFPSASGTVFPTTRVGHVGLSAADSPAGLLAARIAASDPNGIIPTRSRH